MADVEDEADIPAILLPCATCSRTFKPESLSKHTKVCAKTAAKKRKTFDSSKQRIQGTELAEFLPTLAILNKNREKQQVKKVPSKWKERHMELVRAVRAARGIEVSPRPQGSVSKLCDHEKCPHCDRQFGPKAYDRHIEWCKEQKARMPKSPKSTKAKERLEARLKYRAPALMKSRPMLIREKYSSAANLSKSGPNTPTAAAAAPSELTDQPHKSVHAAEKTPHRPQEVVRPGAKPSLQRNASMSGPRSSVGQRSISPVKRVSSQTNKSVGTARSEAIPQIRKGKDTKLKDLASPNTNTARQKVTTPPVVSTPHSSKSRNGEVQEKSCEEIYNPYQSAEQQMQELLFGAMPNSRPSVHSAPNPSTAPLPSAFAKYSSPPLLPSPPPPPVTSSSKWSDSLHELDEIFLSADVGGGGGGGSFFPPAGGLFCNLSDETSESTRGSTLSLCSLGMPPFPDNFGDRDKSRPRMSKIRAKMESASLSLQQSVSLVNYDNEPKRSRGADPVGNGFLGVSSEQLASPDDTAVRSENPLIISNLRDDVDPKSTNGIEQRSDEVMKENVINNNNNNNSNNSSSSSKALEELFTPISNNRYSTASKNSADSAYSSLSRRSPHQTMVDREGNDVERCPTICSSGSESSLPPIGVGQREKAEDSVDSAQQTASLSKLSKFCHECGSKYPVNLAKFCCECGVRRLFV